MKTNIVAGILMLLAGHCFAQQTETLPLEDTRVASVNYFDQPVVQSAAPVAGHVTAIPDSVYGCDSCTGLGGCESCQYTSGRSRGGIVNRLKSRVLPTEDCFDCFISPITNPFYFEDPRALTEFRPVFANHNFPAAVGGGSANVYAAQIRARISENVSFIAVKDGYITSNNPLVGDGWADLSAGLKFHLFRDPARQRLLSAGFTFEAPTGNAAALQGLGSGNLNLFFSTARRFGQFNYMSTGAARLPMDGDLGSTSVLNSHHISRRVTDRMYALTELNWFRWIDDGTAGIPGVEGFDLANLGSTGVDGNNIVTWAFGGKMKTARKNEIGAAYEIPLTSRRDIMGNRITAHWAIRY